MRWGANHSPAPTQHPNLNNGGVPLEITGLASACGWPFTHCGPGKEERRVPPTRSLKVHCCELAPSPLASSPLLDPIFLTARGSGKQRQAPVKSVSAPLSPLFPGAVSISFTNFLMDCLHATVMSWVAVTVHSLGCSTI